MEGTCDRPIFRPDLKAVAAEKVKSLELETTKAAGGLLGGKKNQH